MRLVLACVLAIVWLPLADAPASAWAVEVESGRAASATAAPGCPSGPDAACAGPAFTSPQAEQAWHEQRERIGLEGGTSEPAQGALIGVLVVMGALVVAALWRVRRRYCQRIRLAPRA